MKKKDNESYNNEYVKSVNVEGLPHSIDDKPAMVVKGQGKFWYKDGNLHRDNDQPAAEWDDGSLEFWTNGKKIKKLSKEEAVFYYWKD